MAPIFWRCSGILGRMLRDSSATLFIALKNQPGAIVSFIVSFSFFLFFIFLLFWVLGFGGFRLAVVADVSKNRASPLDDEGGRPVRRNSTESPRDFSVENPILRDSSRILNHSTTLFTLSSRDLPGFFLPGFLFPFFSVERKRQIGKKDCPLKKKESNTFSFK